MRGRQPSITEKLKSYWPRLRSLTGSDRRPRSPTIPPKPKADPTPKRSASMPRINYPAPADSTSDVAPSATVQPTIVVPAVQIPAPVEQPRAEPHAPEVTSDAETLALPGLPGAREEGAVPSPVEEEEHAINDPYVSTVEGEAAIEPPTVPAPTEQATGSTSASLRGFGGLVQVLPEPPVPEVVEKTAKPAAITAETASKETTETPSESVDPTAKPSSGEAEPSKPPSEPRGRD